MNFEKFALFLNYFQVTNILNEEIFTEAVTHASINKKKCYERLEFFGDSVLSFIVSQLLYEKFPFEQEGFLSKKKSILISREVAFQVGNLIKIHEKIIVSLNLQRDLKDNVNIVSACVESLLAVIYLTYGLSKTREIIEKMFLPLIDNVTDSKTKLQELTQKKFKCLPSYKLISRTGPDNNPVFLVSVEVMHYKASGDGSKINLAEKKASDMMYNILLNI